MKKIISILLMLLTIDCSNVCAGSKNNQLSKGNKKRLKSLKKDKEAAETTLDNRYSVMAQQFASYGVMINQMESSFSGLKMLILQSQASR